jgi:CRISPR-associated protein Cas5h
MKLLKVLVFDISGEYGHFRKFNTTSSPLTYAIPTRLALSGILGAILGIERELSPGVFREGVVPLNEVFSRELAWFGVQILRPISKVNIGFNLLDTGKSASSFFNIENRTQIEFELLKNPKFRIYFSHSDESVFDDVERRVKNVSHHFTPYLGLSQFTATVEWVSLEDATQVEPETTEEYIEIRTAVNLSKLKVEGLVKFETDASCTTDTLPMSMRRDRVVSEYAEVLMERSGKPILVKADKYWKTSHGNILFL